MRHNEETKSEDSSSNEEYSKGGQVSELSNIHTNRMGTISFDLKIPGMRKAQDFVVYPIDKDSKRGMITIQSDTRIGLIHLATGRGKMSQSHAGGAYFPHLSMDEKTDFELSPLDAQNLRMQIFSTAGSKVGDEGIVSDNSGATRILENGGEASDYTKNLGRVKVIFINPDYNYYTNVSGDTTEQQARDYFVGKYFNVAPYPKEEMKKVIDIEFYPKGTYDENTMEKGRKTKNKNEITYNGKLITKLFPSGYYEFYSDDRGMFLKFDDLDMAKAAIDRETNASHKISKEAVSNIVNAYNNMKPSEVLDYHELADGNDTTLGMVNEIARKIREGKNSTTIYKEIKSENSMEEGGEVRLPKDLSKKLFATKNRIYTDLRNITNEVANVDMEKAMKINEVAKNVSDNMPDYSSGGTIRKVKVKIPEKPYFVYATIERELLQTIVTNKGIFPKEDVIKEFEVDSRIIMENGGEVKEGKTYPHSGGIARVIRIYEEDGKKKVDYQFTNGLVTKKETQTMNGFLNTIENMEAGGKTRPHGYYIYVTPHNKNFKPHVWTEGGWFPIEEDAEFHARQMRKQKQDYDKTVPFYDKVEVRPATEEEKISMIVPREAMASGGNILPSNEKNFTIKEEETNNTYGKQLTYVMDLGQVDVGNNHLQSHLMKALSERPDAEEIYHAIGNMLADANIKIVYSDKYGNKYHDTFVVEEFPRHLIYQYSSGGEVKMKHSKNHYRDMEYNGYIWEGFWNGKHHFVKKVDEGYAEIKATDEDLENGNIEFMAEHNLSNERRLELGGILLAGLLGAAIGGAAGYGYRDSISSARERAVDRAIKSKQASKDKYERQIQKLKDTKEGLKSKAISGIQKLADGGRVKTIKESDIQPGAKFELINGEIVEIKRLFKENMDEDWAEFTRSSIGKAEESSVKQLKNFINNWRAEKKSSGGYMESGGKISAEKKKLQGEIKILQDAIDNSLLDDETKAKIPAKIEAKKNRIAEIEEEETAQARKEEAEKIERNQVEKEKKLRTQSSKNKNIYIDIDKRLKEKMRNAIHSEGIPYQSKTEGDVFRVFLSNQYQLDIVTRLYNEKREKLGMEPVEKMAVADIVKKRVGKLKFMPVKVKPNVKEKLPVEKKRPIKKAEKKRIEAKNKLESEDEE